MSCILHALPASCTLYQKNNSTSRDESIRETIQPKDGSSTDVKLGTILHQRFWSKRQKSRLSAASAKSRAAWLDSPARRSAAQSGAALERWNAQSYDSAGAKSVIQNDVELPKSSASGCR